MERLALVTGGSGFAGSRLIRMLLEQRWQVRGLGRSKEALDKIARAGAEPVPGDLADPASLAPALHHCTAVFHAAAMFRFWGDPHEFERVKVNGTKALLEAAAQSGTVRQFIQIGAAAVVMGDPEPMRAAQEDLPIQTRRWAPYSSSKAKADALVREASETSGLHTVVVRPPMIWGLGMPMIEEMRKRVQNGQFRWPGDGSQPLSTCHVDNVCHGAILAAQAGPHASGNAYFLSDGEDGTLRQVISDLLTAHGIEPPTSSSPFPLAWQLAKVLELAWNTLPLPGEPLLTRQMLRLIGMPFTLDITRARVDLGYQPIVSWQQGIQALRTS